MRIAVSSTGNTLDSLIDPRFGRCQYFIYIDTETMEFEAVSNKSAMASGGAGIQAAQSAADRHAEAVITGNIGPNAFQSLSAAGIKVITGAQGSVKEAVERFTRGDLEESDNASVGSHFGMGGRGIGR